MVVSDSGGLQKEAYFFEKQCIVTRDETEWVELVDHGSNELVGVDRARSTLLIKMRNPIRLISQLSSMEMAIARKRFRCLSDNEVNRMKNFALIGAAGYIAPRHLRAIKGYG